MKKSKLLSKNISSILLFIFIFLNCNLLFAEDEPIDIWNIEEKENRESQNNINSENVETELNLKINYEKLYPKKQKK